MEAWRSLEAIFFINLLLLRQESTKANDGIVSGNESHDSNLFIPVHFLNKGIDDLRRTRDSFFIWINEVRMLYVVVDFQIRARLEAHQLHSNCIEILYLLHIIRGDLDFLTSNWVEGTDLVLVKNCACLITNESLSRFQRFIVCSINLLRGWLFSWHYSGIETKCNLSLGSQTKKTLTLSSLPKLFLSNPLHQLSYAILSPLYT